MQGLQSNFWVVSLDEMFPVKILIKNLYWWIKKNHQVRCFQWDYWKTCLAKHADFNAPCLPTKPAEHRECSASSPSSLATPSVGLWHLPNSQTASLIPLIFTAQKTKVFVCCATVSLLGVLFVRDTPHTQSYTGLGHIPIADTFSATDCMSHSHNTWCKTGLIGMTSCREAVICYHCTEWNETEKWRKAVGTIVYILKN